MMLMMLNMNILFYYRKNIADYGKLNDDDVPVRNSFNAIAVKSSHKHERKFTG